jgi:hypothetical protein
MISFCHIIRIRAVNSNALTQVKNASQWPQGYLKLYITEVGPEV